MQVLYILPKRATLTNWVHEIPSLSIRTLSPTLLSAFTAMRIAKVLDTEPIDIIMTYTLQDAVAAISARKISRNKPKIACELSESEVPPHCIPSEVSKNVDAWLCATKRTQELISNQIGKIALLSPSTIWKVTPVLPKSDWQYTEPANKKAYLWVGSIDNNTNRLREAIEIANSCPRDITLRIWGTGKAQLVMPLVRLTRGIENPKRIEWIGDSMTLDNALENAYCLVLSNDEPEQLELELGRKGMPLINPQEIGNPETLTNEYHTESQLCDELLQVYNSIRQPN